MRSTGRLKSGLNRLPGVHGRGLALYNPLTDNWGELIYVSGHPPPKMNEESGASWDRVSADYLQNFGVTIVARADFTAADNETTAPVAIVNRGFRETLLQERTKIRWASTSAWTCRRTPARFASWASCATRSSRAGDLRRPARPMFYVPLAQNVDYKEPI